MRRLCVDCMQLEYTAFVPLAFKPFSKLPKVVIEIHTNKKT